MNKKPRLDKMECEVNRRNFLKIPLITTGVMIGSTLIPPFMQVAIAATEQGAKIIEGWVSIGLWKFTLPLPPFIINKVVYEGAQRSKQKVRQFSRGKKAVHHFVVRELAIKGESLSLDLIAKGLDMPLNEVALLVNELEQDKTFLYRKGSDRINWAYPVTVDDTPHQITFSTGERINAA